MIDIDISAALIAEAKERKRKSAAEKLREASIISTEQLPEWTKELQPADRPRRPE
jgi:hypothetical protein